MAAEALDRRVADREQHRLVFSQAPVSIGLPGEAAKTLVCVALVVQTIELGDNRRGGATLLHAASNLSLTMP